MVRRGFIVASVLTLALAANLEASGFFSLVPNTQAIAATRTFTSAWDIREFIKTIPGITHIPGPIPDHGSGAPRNDQTTANAICAFAGYQTAQITAVSNYHSCGDNTIGYWNGSNFVIYNACNYNSFIHGLLCSNPLQCQDGADNDGDGLVDFPADGGCTGATDNDESNPALAVDLKINGQNGTITVPTGTVVTLSWTSSNVARCSTGTSNMPGWGPNVAQPVNGSQQVTVTQSGTYGIHCAQTATSNFAVQDSVAVNLQVTTQCSDGIDNDGDGQTDFPADGGCENAQDNAEATSGVVPPICANSFNSFATSLAGFTMPGGGIANPNRVLGAPDGNGADFDNTSSQQGFVSVAFAQPIVNVPGDDFAVYVVDFFTGEPVEVFEVLVQNGSNSPVSLGTRTPTQTTAHLSQRLTFDIGPTGLSQATRIIVRNVTAGLGAHIGPDIDAFENISACTGGAAQCSDGLDNDFDGAVDGADFSCSGSSDNDETNPKAACQDGSDNDGDGLVDFPLDLGCTSRQDNDETGGSSQACHQASFHASVGSLQSQGWTALDPGANQSAATLTENGVTFVRITDNSTTRGLRTEYPAIADASLADRDWTLEMKARILASNSGPYPALSGMNMLLTSPGGKYVSIYIDTNKFGPIGPSLTQYEYGRTANRNTSDGFHIYQITHRKNGAGIDDDTFDILFDGQVAIAAITRSEIWNSGVHGQNINGISFGIGSSPGTGVMDVAYVTFRNTESFCPALNQCSDGIDNDNDGAVDSADFSCSGSGDNDETNPKAACQDGVDNDGDGQTDFPNDPGCTSRQDNDETGGGSSGSCTEGGQVLASVYSAVNAANDPFSLNQSRTSAYCNGTDLLLAGAGAGPSCDNSSSPACGLEMHYEFNSFNPQGQQNGWTANYSVPGDAFYDTVRAEVRCVPNVAVTTKYFSTYVRTSGPIANYYALNQNKNVAYCDPGDTAIHGGGTNVFCDGPGNGGCGIQMLEFNGRIIDGNREGWVANYSMPGDATYDTIQTTVVCLKKTSLFDQALRVYHVVNEANPVDYYSLNQNRTEALCNTGDIAIGGGGSAAYCDNASNPACGKIQYLEHNGQVTVSGRQGWRTSFDLGGDATYDTQRTAVTCLGLANTCTGGGTQCSDGIDNDNDGAVDSADFSCSGSGDNDETNPKAACQDGVDNDGDGQTDFPNDPGCTSRQDNDESGSGGGNPQCNDFLDNDGDGLIDIADPGCHHDFNRFNTASYNPNGTSEASNQGKGTCADGIDNNGNFLIDAFDASCHTDGNTANPSSFDPSRNETGTGGGTQCSDGVDNDFDGATDLSDFSCSGSGDNDETNPKAACQDGVDNDGDGQTDFPNDPGCTSRQDNDESGSGGGNPQCNDGVDNDFDGATDLSDFSCSSGSDNDETNPKSQCQDGVDNDGDGQTDFPNDSGCTSRQDNDEGTSTDAATDLSVTLTGPSSVTRGGTVTYTATVTNNGPATANNVRVTDPPAGFTFLPGSSSSSCVQSGTAVVCTLATLPSGSSQSFTIAFSTSSSSCNISVTDIATVTANNPDPNSANNQSQSVVTFVNCQGTGGNQCQDGLDNDGDGLTDSADPDCHTDGNAQNGASYDPTRSETSSTGGDGCLDITIEDDQDPAEPGDTVEYDITVENECSTSRTFTLRALLDNDMDFEDASGNGDDINDEEVQWQNVTIAAGDEREFTLEVELDDSLDDGDEVELEARIGSNKETETTDIGDDDDDDGSFGGSIGGGVNGALLSVSKTADRSTAQPGDSVSYSIVIRNGGNRAAQNVVVEDQFNAGQLSILDPAGGSVNGSTLRWTLDRVDANTTRTLRYTARISGSMRHGDVVQNNVRVNGGAGGSAGDSNTVRIIQQLPQTGIGGPGATLRPVRSSRAAQAESPLGGIAALLATVTSGVGLGAIVGRRLLTGL